MDWVEDKLNQRFVFRNPNISESSLRAKSAVTGILTEFQRSNVVVANHSWSSIAFQQHVSNSAISGIRTRRPGASKSKRTMSRNSNTTKPHSKTPYPPPSKHTRQIIKTPNLLHHILQPLLKLPMRRVFIQIILPVLLALKLHHKPILIYRLNTPKHNAFISKPQSPTPREGKTHTNFSGFACFPPDADLI